MRFDDADWTTIEDHAELLARLRASVAEHVPPDFAGHLAALTIGVRVLLTYPYVLLVRFAAPEGLPDSDEPERLQQLPDRKLVERSARVADSDRGRDHVQVRRYQ